jgi:hypothetical protein
MKLKTHVSSALAVAPFVAFSGGALHFLLMGSVFPDTDLTVKNVGHRMSLLHTIEIPLFGFLFLRFIKVPYMFGFPVGYFARCFFAGWLMHLLGDFVQGGVRSLVFKKRIGFRNFTWDKYYNTPAGLGVDILVSLAAFWGLYSFFFTWNSYFAILSVVVAYCSGRAITAFTVLVAMPICVVYLAKVT